MPPIGYEAQYLGAGEQTEECDSARESTLPHIMRPVAGADTCFEGPRGVARGAAQAANITSAKPVRARSLMCTNRGEGGKRAPRRAGGRAVGETLGEGRKRRAQAANVPPPREGEERKRVLRSASQSMQRHVEGAQ